MAQNAVWTSLVLLWITACSSSLDFGLPSPWTWRCVTDTPNERVLDGDRCIREPLVASSSSSSSLTACQLTCGKYGSLWPRPRSARIGLEMVSFLPKDVNTTLMAEGDATKLLRSAVDVFMHNLDRYHPDYSKRQKLWPDFISSGPHKLQLVIKILDSSVTYLALNTTQESYTLQMETISTTTNAIITANTFFGARNALETLSQLIGYEEIENSLQLVSFAEISDEPAFPYRGLLLDTSRNYINLETIKRTLDGMAANKLNTFHWHITDTHSFPLVLQSLPLMAYYGAYSPRHVYQADEVRAIVEYGRVRGIRVLPELDAPAHVGNGWQWGPQQGLGNLVVCVNQEPWQEYCVEPPCGQLNIANPNIYPVLGKIYQELIDIFGPIDLFHYGGDEVNVNCWNSTQEITSWMTAKGENITADSFYNQWSHFQNNAYQLFTEANKGVEIPGILWTSHLTEKGRTDQYLDKNKYIIQIWSTGDDPLIKELLDKRYKLIFSNYDAWYLDCGFGAWVGSGTNWCSPYKGWQTVYDNSPFAIARNITNNTADLSLILGGEAALWTEQVDSQSVDGRLWPRGAALAERLWSNPEENWKAAEWRLVHHRQRLVQRGLAAERLQPEWCHQNQGLCYL